MVDSAGVEIVLNDRASWREGEGWRIPEQPEVDIGVVDGDPAYQFSDVRGAARLSDGTIVVANGQSNELRFFDRAGRHLRTAGRTGGGPGEFRGLQRVMRLAGDTLATWDFASRRVSYFAPGGEFVRSIDVPLIEGRSIPRVDGVFADGSLLVTPLINPAFRPGTDIARDTATYLRLSRTGEPMGTLGRFPGQQTVSVATTGEGQFNIRTNLPFGLATFRAVRGERLYVGDSERYEIAVHDAGGRVVRRVRKSHRPIPLTPEEVESFKQRERERGAPGGNRQVQERMLAAMRFPETKAAFEDLAVDAEGAIWVREYPEVGDDNPEWTVFDPAGRLLGRVAVPVGVTVLDIGPDYLLGVWRDDLDVEHVRLYRLEKDRAG